MELSKEVENHNSWKTCSPPLGEKNGRGDLFQVVTHTICPLERYLMGMMVKLVTCKGSQGTSNQYLAKSARVCLFLFPPCHYSNSQFSPNFLAAFSKDSSSMKPLGFISLSLKLWFIFRKNAKSYSQAVGLSHNGCFCSWWTLAMMYNNLRNKCL